MPETFSIFEPGPLIVNRGCGQECEPPPYQQVDGQSWTLGVGHRTLEIGFGYSALVVGQ